MPNETSTETTETTTEETTPPTDETSTETTEETTEEKPENELPEWAKGELTKARGDAANYRVKLREAQEALGKAKTPEEYDAAVGDLNSKIAELEHSILRRDVAAKHNLPADLADALKGDDEAALEAHAKVLAKYAGPPAPQRLDGGLTPGSDEETTDPGKLARKYTSRR